MNSPSGRVPGRALEPSRDGFGADGGYVTLRGFLLGYLGFFRDGDYMGEEAESEAAGATRHTPGAAKGGATPGPCLARLLASFSSPSGYVFVTEN